MRKFIKFTEFNDWEGETWNFYILKEGNYEALLELKHLLEATEMTDEFAVFDSDVPENTVDVMCNAGNKGSRNSYIPEYNKLEGKLDVSDLIPDYKKLHEKLYKGKIWELVS